MQQEMAAIREAMQNNEDNEDDALVSTFAAFVNIHKALT